MEGIINEFLVFFFSILVFFIYCILLFNCFFVFGSFILVVDV